MKWICLLAIFCAGCQTITRKQVDASVWLNNGPLPPEICTREPSLQQYGFYRRLSTGKLEFISFCAPDSDKWISVYSADFYKYLDALLP